MKTRASLFAAFAAPALSFLMTACAADVSDNGARANQGDGPHAMFIPDAKGKADKASSYGDPHLSYRGGAVIPNVEVWTVFWSAKVPNQKDLNDFYSTITSSPYFDWLHEYDTPSQKIGQGSLAGSIVVTGAPTSKNLDDSQIQAQLGKLIDQGKLPPPDENKLYMVHFPAGVGITMEGMQSCQQFCAYHGTFIKNGVKAYYGVMPDMSGGCAGCGGGNNKLQNTTIVSSHELIEAVTDPAVGLQDEPQLGWYDDQRGEVGDICEGQNSLVSGYAVQNEWSNGQGACIAR